MYVKIDDEGGIAFWFMTFNIFFLSTAQSIFGYHYFKKNHADPGCDSRLEFHYIIYFENTNTAAVAQSVRAFASHAEGWVLIPQPQET